MKFRTRFTERHRVDFQTEGPSMVQEQFKEECDVNNIIARHRKMGLSPFQQPNPDAFGDFTQITDFQSALEKTMEAENEFMKLPSAIRARFENDPVKLVQFLSNLDNDQEAVKLGLKKIVAPEPTIADHMETALERNDQKRQKRQEKKNEQK